MSDKHETDLVNLIGGRRTRASGAIWTDQADGRHDPQEMEYAFAWDGKSTFGGSIGISRKMWEKLCEHVHGARPAIPLRFYDNQRLDLGLDLVVLDLDDFAELLEAANRAGSLPPEDELLDKLADAITAHWYQRAEQRIEASPEDHSRAMAQVVMDVLAAEVYPARPE
jgi:hypothetical protein